MAAVSPSPLDAPISAYVPTSPPPEYVRSFLLLNMFGVSVCFGLEAGTGASGWPAGPIGSHLAPMGPHPLGTVAGPWGLDKGAVAGAPPRTPPKVGCRQAADFWRCAGGRCPPTVGLGGIF